jgi:cytochrome P450
MRRASAEALTKRMVQKYQPIQTKEANILVSSLLTPSADLRQDRHFKRLAASTIMSIVYDYPTIMSEHDHVVEEIERYNDRLSHAFIVGSYFVDIFPWMNHIPARFWPFFRGFVRILTEHSNQICEMEAGGFTSICGGL